MEAHNVDSTLAQIMTDQLTGTAEPKPPLPQEQPEPEPQPEPDPVPEETPADDSDPYGTQESEPEQKAEEPAKESDTPIDEYGNPVAKPKMYSEDEVQRMIRERLSRGRNADTQQVKKEAEGFQHDPDSEDSWEVQLERFVENTIEKREKKRSEQEWQRQEAARQADFEAKFTSGMQKYPDFREVVADKPITDSMMIAARSLENPAAFIYGASKMHANELNRIAKIPDPFTQAAEIGRLHERMVKERKIASSAAKPLETPKSDMPAKKTNDLSLDQRIHQYAKQKRK